MRRTSSWLFSLSLLFILFSSPAEATSSVFLSQVQITGEKADDEFVELYNPTENAVNLSGWSIRKKSKGDITAKGASLKTFGKDNAIPAHGYFLWANTQSIFATLADTTTGSSLTDDNSLGLFDNKSVLLDSVTWGSGHTLPFSPPVSGNPDKKEKIVRDKTSLTWSLSKNSKPTNSKGETYEEPKEEVSTPAPSGPFSLRINEVFPNPETKNDAGEFIELYNFGDTAVDLSNWTLRDASKTGKYVFPKDTKIEKRDYLLLTDEDFTFSLNNTDETLSLFDANGDLVHSVGYEKTKEGVSLNYVDGKLRGSQTPTPGEANLLDNDPITEEKVPKKGYTGVAVNFNARGWDKDGDKLKFTWDFGDGHKSYKEKTAHKYLKGGHYTVTLTTDDGKDTTTETFDIKITKYEYPDIHITRFLPNPEGKDTDNEWVEVENRGKKEINLKEFGIATGTKTLVNHPIHNDFIIPKKSVKRLTRQDSLFVLGNIKSKIELRAPDGKVLQKLKYKFEKSLAENTLLQKEKGKSLIVVAPPEKTPDETPPSNEVPEELILDSSSDTLPEDPSSLPSPSEEVLPPNESIPSELESPSNEVTLPSENDIPKSEESSGIYSQVSSFIQNFLSTLNTKLNSLLARGN